jgi:AAA+ superfamily predicted ATPase
MKKLYIAVFNDYTERFCDIVTAESEELLLKQLEAQFCNEVEFKTKEDVEKHLEMYHNELQVDMEVTYKEIDLSK